MALPTYEMGSYGLLMRTKSGLFEIVDACIAAAASLWPEELQAQRDHILRLLGVDPLLKAPPEVAAGNGNGQIMAEIIVTNRKLRRPPMKSSAKEAVVAAEANRNRKAPREFPVEEKRRKIDGGRVLGFAAGKEEEMRSRCSLSPRKGETTADHHHHRRRRLEDDDYYGGRKRNLDRVHDRYYDDGCKRNFDRRYYSGRSEDRYHEERRCYDGRRRHEEEYYYSAKRRRVDKEAATATTTARRNHRVIRYSRRFLLSLQPMD